MNLNCGGHPLGLYRFGSTLHGIYARDWFSRGGQTSQTTNAIDTQVADAAPAAVYQTERWGACAYTLPVGKGRPCTVRLHFAEVKFGPGERKFNVDLNGRRVLSEFDIAAEAGQHKALVKDFPGIVPDAEGNIRVNLTRGSVDEPKLCGIQVLR